MAGETFYPMLQLCSGDNLSIHEYMGLIGGFSANYPCRFCKLHRTNFNEHVYDDKLLYRTIANYNDDLSVNDQSKTGIREECCFNKLYSTSGFHLTANYVVDMSHDILEGVADYLLPRLINYLVFHREYFELHTLNRRCSTYLFDHSTKPSFMKEKHIKAGNTIYIFIFICNFNCFTIQ